MELIAFPFAGGSEYCYRELETHLNGINLTTLALPGRGSLIGQPCITSIEKMVDYLLPQIQPLIHQPYAFFGHSMGAFIAYMLCRKINQHALPMPKLLILSGRKAPSVKEQTIKHTLPDKEFRDMLQNLGGIPNAVWQDDEIMALFEPIIRSDFELIETYSHQVKKPMDLTIQLFLGQEDNVTTEQARAWQKETSQALNISYFPGGHFYFQDNWRLLGNKIVNVLDENKIKSYA